jgi:integrase
VAVLGRFFRFGADKGWLETNPAIRLPKAVEEVSRERVLSAAELGAIWNALFDGEGHAVYSQILALLALTGCRVSEIASLRREDIDLDAGTIKIAKGKTKDAARELPVGDTARAMLVKIAKSADPNGPLFSAPGGGAIDVPTVGKAARRLCARLQYPRWTPHDLRRTLISELHEAGFGEGIIRRLAGHTAKDVHDSVYDRSKRLESIRKALEHYENHILDCAAEAKRRRKATLSRSGARLGVSDYALV